LKTTLHAKLGTRSQRCIEESGTWRDKKVDIEGVFTEYFNHLLAAQRHINTTELTCLVQPMVTDEVMPAINQMQPTKAPSPNSGHVLFVQNTTGTRV